MNVLTAIIEIRTAIRHHRDQKGDDRCWLDDLIVWRILEDTPAEITALPNKEKMMRLCTDFYTFRRSETVETVPEDAITDAARWDADLEGLNESELTIELEKLQSAVRAHRDIKNRPLTLDDDRKLYAVLPEKLPADFRLPPENQFLTSQTPTSGCPNFWQSHQTCPCKEHDLHKWGPCCK